MQTQPLTLSALLDRYVRECRVLDERPDSEQAYEAAQETHCDLLDELAADGLDEAQARAWIEREANARAPR